MPESTTPLSRRRFVGAAGLVAGSMITRPLFGQNAASNKLNVALIGVWGRGLAHYDSISEENVVALCDINEARFPDALKRFPNAKTYIDWRKCLDHKGPRRRRHLHAGPHACLSSPTGRSNATCMSIARSRWPSR
jgi:hypothetical protein